MKETLEKYYEKYLIINKALEENKALRNKLFNNLSNTKKGKFYFGLTKEQKETYLNLYHEYDILRYLEIEEASRRFNIMRQNLLEDFIYSKSFPLSSDTRLNIYIKDGIDTYNAINNKSTKDLDLTDELKKFIMEVISNTYGISDTYTKDDIPLINLIVERAKKRNMPLDDIEDFVLGEVYDIHKKDGKRKNSDVTLNINKIDEMINMNVTKEGLTTSRFKDLFVEESLVAFYKRAILAGDNVVDLYNELEKLNRIDHIYALVKAYYILTYIEFRKENVRDKEFETSNPKVNQKILDMRK